MTTQVKVWSCGGGTQSAAIAALICEGRLPKPDLAVIVDTEREKESTWVYLDDVLRPNLATVGVEIHRVLKSDFGDFDIWAHDEESCLLPVFSTRDGAGKCSNFCSEHWKRETIWRWLRSQGVERGESWVGISRDEMRRIRAPRRQWLQERYPLIFDMPMTRAECLRYVCEDMGWPEPPRSSCWCCPNMRDAEWREIKRNRPWEFEYAVRLEREIQQRDPHAWLHSSCKPLDAVDFTNYQQQMDFGCDSGYCFV